MAPSVPAGLGLTTCADLALTSVFRVMATVNDRSAQQAKSGQLSIGVNSIYFQKSHTDLFPVRQDCKNTASVDVYNPVSYIFS